MNWMINHLLRDVTRQGLWVIQISIDWPRSYQQNWIYDNYYVSQVFPARSWRSFLVQGVEQTRYCSDFVFPNGIFATVTESLEIKVNTHFVGGDNMDNHNDPS